MTVAHVNAWKCGAVTWPAPTRAQDEAQSPAFKAPNVLTFTSINDISTLTIPDRERNAVHRHRERAKYDLEGVHAIFNVISIVCAAFAPTNPSIDPFPTIIP